MELYLIADIASIIPLLNIFIYEDNYMNLTSLLILIKMFELNRILEKFKDILLNK